MRRRKASLCYGSPRRSYTQKVLSVGPESIDGSNVRHWSRGLMCGGVVWSFDVVCGGAIESSEETRESSTHRRVNVCGGVVGRLRE